MVVLSPVRPKRLLYFVIVSLFCAILIFLHSKDENNNNNNSLDIPPVIGFTLPSLERFEYLSGTALPCGADAPQLLAFIHSSPTNIPYRSAIRRTWGSPAHQNIRTLFIVGRSADERVRQRIQQEAEEFGDLVLLSIVDSYKNLTLKHLSGLKWITKKCPRVPYVLKADDDTFVDTYRLFSLIHLFLGESASSKHSLVCHVIPDGTSPQRSGKWAVTRDEYPYEEYPEYCSGVAYFTRMSTLGNIYQVASSGGVPYLRIDDVFVTGLGASLAGVRRQDLGVRFANTELPVIEWMRGKSLRPSPWMVAEISPYYWPKEAFTLWNKTILAWGKLNKLKNTPSFLTKY